MDVVALRDHRALSNSASGSSNRLLDNWDYSTTLANLRSSDLPMPMVVIIQAPEKQL